MPIRCRQILPTLAVALLLPGIAAAQRADEDYGPWWLGFGLGAGSINSLAPAPAADRDAVAASIEFGYRMTRDWGAGLELGTVIPVSGCADWSCAESQADFAPRFSRFFAFGEFRPPDSGWRLRAGIGISRFCYQRHWSSDGWSLLDTLLFLFDEDYLHYSDGGSGAYHCDASRNALGGSVSAGYDWRVARGTPLSMGVRITAEAANYGEIRSIDLPRFKHRSVTLTVHLNLN